MKWWFARNVSQNESLSFFENEEVTILCMLYDLTKVWLSLEKFIHE